MQQFIYRCEIDVCLLNTKSFFPKPPFDRTRVFKLTRWGISFVRKSSQVIHLNANEWSIIQIEVLCLYSTVRIAYLYDKDRLIIVLQFTWEHELCYSLISTVVDKRVVLVDVISNNSDTRLKPLYRQIFSIFYIFTLFIYRRWFSWWWIMVVTTDQDLIRIFRVGRDKFSS